jgi:hypothetical protein
LQAHAEPGSILVSHKTYSLIKDSIFAIEQDPIQPKGFAKPVRNYKIVDPPHQAAGRKRIIREEQDGLRVFLDLQKLDEASAAEALKSILSRLGS